MDLARGGLGLVKAVASFHGILDDAPLAVRAEGKMESTRVLLCHGEMDPFVQDKQVHREDTRVVPIILSMTLIIIRPQQFPITYMNQFPIKYPNPIPPIPYLQSHTSNYIPQISNYIPPITYPPNQHPMTYPSP